MFLLILIKFKSNKSSTKIQSIIKLIYLSNKINWEKIVNLDNLLITFNINQNINLYCNKKTIKKLVLILIEINDKIVYRIYKISMKLKI